MTKPWRLGVIPARANSTRFPNKVIVPLLGKPMIQYVWEAAKRSTLLDEVCIATDCEKVAEIARSFGAEVQMTPENLASGTDRVALVARRKPGATLVLNLQGDEPMMTSWAIDSLIQALEANPDSGMATLAVERSTSDELGNPNVVKVVTDRVGKAIYFSRHPIGNDGNQPFLKHIGIYAFRADVLRAFCEWEPAPLEVQERLEQLRALYHGVKIQVVTTQMDTIAVDRPEDVDRVESFLRSFRCESKGTEDKIRP